MVAHKSRNAQGKFYSINKRDQIRTALGMCEVRDCYAKAHCGARYCERHRMMKRKYGHTDDRRIQRYAKALPLPIGEAHWDSGGTKWKTHRLTRSDVELMLEFQGYRCVICRATFKKPSGKIQFDVDHEYVRGDKRESLAVQKHRPGAWFHTRGFLCHKCNAIVGFFERNRDSYSKRKLPQKLEDYVRRPIPQRMTEAGIEHLINRRGLDVCEDAAC